MKQVGKLFFSIFLAQSQHAHAGSSVFDMNRTTNNWSGWELDHTLDNDQRVHTFYVYTFEGNYHQIGVVKADATSIASLRSGSTEHASPDAAWAFLYSNGPRHQGQGHVEAWNTSWNGLGLFTLLINPCKREFEVWRTPGQFLGRMSFSKDWTYFKPAVAGQYQGHNSWIHYAGSVAYTPQTQDEIRHLTCA